MRTGVRHLSGHQEKPESVNGRFGWTGADRADSRMERRWWPPPGPQQPPIVRQNLPVQW